jgi:hypothetical protein
MLNRVRCLIGLHDWPEWGTWVHGGRSKYYRQRFCRRCGRAGTEIG